MLLDDNKSTSTKTTPQTRLLTGNAVVDGAVVGIGVGVIGSLLVGKLLDDQSKKCHYRYRRDSPSAR